MTTVAGRRAAAESWAGRLGAVRRRISVKRNRTGVERGWRERVGIEPTGAAEGASIAVLKTGQTTRPDPPPLLENLLTSYFSLLTAAITSISTLAPRGRAATATVERAGLWVPNARP